jgi:hypothetical protein
MRVLILILMLTFLPACQTLNITVYAIVCDNSTIRIVINQQKPTEVTTSAQAQIPVSALGGL